MNYHFEKAFKGIDTLGLRSIIAVEEMGKSMKVVDLKTPYIVRTYRT